MVHENGRDGFFDNSDDNRLNAIQSLRRAVREQEIYVSQLEERKTIRGRLLHQLTCTLRQLNFDASTNMEKGIGVEDGVCNCDPETNIPTENEILGDAKPKSPEINSSRLIFSDMVHIQLSALDEDNRWGQEEGSLLSARAPIDTLLGVSQDREINIKPQNKRRKKRKNGQGAVKLDRGSKSVEILRRIKVKDEKDREELFKGLERVIEENPQTFSSVSGVISVQPPWLTDSEEIDTADFEGAKEKNLKGIDDYSDDFEDD
ncbi:unnamed protein product [Phytomonas sp. Hart1]|nr:unnamed protein product [Phytomonas sp. Hart1]|eukprot:CCW67808.1 unnamed protein product [Phytomonas sp. isolate Hart1]